MKEKIIVVYNNEDQDLTTIVTNKDNVYSIRNDLMDDELKQIIRDKDYDKFLSKVNPLEYMLNHSLDEDIKINEHKNIIYKDIPINPNLSDLFVNKYYKDKEHLDDIINFNIFFNSLKDKSNKTSFENIILDFLTNVVVEDKNINIEGDNIIMSYYNSGNHCIRFIQYNSDRPDLIKFNYNNINYLYRGDQYWIFFTKVLDKKFLRKTQDNVIPLYKKCKICGRDIVNDGEDICDVCAYGMGYKKIKIGI